ncbi:MAG TPA: radical SAM protein [Planctomycetota bacterium]|nr:radical SAM protein [Planctomycetota bacterium]
MRVLLATTLAPEFVKVWLCQQTSTAGSRVPPSDLAAIGASLRRDGHEVALAELRYASAPLALFREIQERFPPDAVVLNLTTPSAPLDYRILGAARPGAQRLVFGTHALAFPAEAFEHGVDAILWGDPEAALRNALGSPGGHDGVVRPGQTPADTPPAYVDSLDDLPYQDLSLLDLSLYHAPYIPRGRRFTMMLTARGCPFRCTFCQHPILFGPKYRSQSPGRVVDELVALRDQYGVREAMFLDATFNVSERWVAAFCEEMLRRAVGVRWSCNLRARPAGIEMLRLMKRAGCRHAMFGVEDLQLLDEVRKGITSHDVFEAFRAARQAGLSTVAYVMLFRDAPCSEREYPGRILKLIRRLGADAVQVNVAIPLPGTALYDEMARDGGLSTDWTTYDPGGDRLPYRSDLDLVAIRERIVRRLPFARPLRTLRQVCQLDARSLLSALRRYVRSWHGPAR